ncbi:ABC transporter ced-7 [Aphelenchoides besseyi]|nr:ABC transporter ced-7 [Aphelenchoides besseyi]
MSTQLYALWVKDLQIAKRSKCRSCCELAVPLFMLPFLIVGLVLTLQNIKHVEFKAQTINAAVQKQLQNAKFINMSDEDFEIFKKSADELDINIARNGTSIHYFYVCEVEFVEFDIQTPKFRYTLRSSETEYGDSLFPGIMSSGWLSNNPFDTESFIYTIDSYQYSFPKDLFTYQRTIDAILLNIKGIKSTDTLNFDYIPTKGYKWSGYNAALPYLAVLIISAALIPMGTISKDVITEVEADIKVYLLIMGMNRFSFYFSHLINGCIKMWIVMLILMLPIACALRFTTGITLLLLIFVFSITAVTYSLFWTTMFRKPGLCITFIIISAILLTVFSFVSPQNRLDIGMMCVSSLNPVFALKAGLHDLRFYDRHGMFPWPGNRMGYQFNIFFAFLFLIIDTVIIVLLTFLLDTFKKRKRRVAPDEEAEEKADFESIRRKDRKADISVYQLRKKWDFGDYAVNGVDFAAYRGEISCLLGHNGAGKSTLFSCLTGYTKPTSGTVLVYGNNVLSQLAEIRKHLGYCPQSNPLYDRLTCSEHLRLAVRLRGVKCDDEEIAETLGAVGLWNQYGTQAYQLSGGMKRKLCVAMALVGKSRVVLLDEPTAGMDPTARKQIGEILDKFKTDRSILLTTHYMDDADRLSDRILIMVKGRVVCNGTPEFLKKRFGTGFLLTISLANGSMHAEQKAQRILGIAQQLVPEAKFSGSPAAQFTINLPYESKIKFAQLFTVLETRGQELDIDSFGLSVNTLEQVFIKVGEKAEGESNEELRARIVKNANVVRQGDHERSPSIFKQWFALCIRNFIYWIRHPIRTVIPLVVILACFIFLLIRRGQTGTEVQFDFKGGVHYHDLSDIPRSKVFVDQMFHDQISSLFSSIKQCSIVQGTATEQNNFDIPPPSIGFYNNNGLSSFSINRFFSDGYFLAMSAYSNMLFGKNSPNTITMGIRGNYTADMISGIIGPLFTNLLNSAFACFGLTFGMAMLLAEVVTERITKFKHQIRLTGCRASTYWFSQMSTDFCYFLVLAIFVFSMSLVATKIYFSCATAVLPIFLMYFVAASLASYVLSFLFESATKGTVFVLAFHTIIPLVTFVLCIIGLGILSVIARIDFLEHKESSTSPSVFNIVQLLLGIIFPAIPLFATEQQAVFICLKKEATFGDNYRMLNANDFVEIILPQNTVLDVPAMRSIISLSISIILYLVLLILIETGVIRALRGGNRNFSVAPAAHGFSDDDPDVRAERQAMDGTSDQALALSCRGLYKFYGAKCALQNLTFGIRSGECFGLLGINGAVDTTPAIGYCPQFDALSGFLTAADTLRLFGRLNGFRDVENRMQMILECVMLEDHANKIVKKCRLVGNQLLWCNCFVCSGGQNRRVSIAVALMSGAECLLLDEPTAGVDPATRRQIWDLLTAVRLQGKAILLTTHSMEECEALCTRIGFLRDGRLQGIGTSQHLKNRQVYFDSYGNSYNLTFILDHVPHDVAAVVDAAVQQRFGVPPTTDAYQLAILSWNIPRRPDFKWSQMYMAVEKLISNIHQTNPGAIRDFFLIQDSLEQVFTRLATNEDASRVVVMQPPVYSATPVQEIPLSTDPPVSTPNHRISVISAQPWVLPSQQTSELNSRHLNGNPDFTKL